MEESAFPGKIALLDIIVFLEDFFCRMRGW
jgi:hypothetical protein